MFPYYVLFLNAFNLFLFPFCRCVTIMWISLYLSCLRFTHLFESVVYIFLPIWGVFSHCFFEFFLSPALSSPFGMQKIEMLMLFLLSQGPWESGGFFFQSIFLFVIEIEKFCWSDLTFADSILSHLRSAAETVQRGFSPALIPGVISF